MLKKICKKPFEFLEITSGKGNPAFLCCPSWLTKDIGATKHNSVMELWRGKEATDIRKSVIDGSFRYCNHGVCPYLRGSQSEMDNASPVQIVDDKTYRSYLEQVYAPEAHLLPPKLLNCAYDNSCNLSCPSCRTHIIQSDKAERADKQELIEKVLQEIGGSLELLYVTGSGDPFGSRHFSELLTSDLVASFPNLRFRLHTNALMLDELRWNRISRIHDKIIEIEISIDGATERTYEENRFPGKWSDILLRMDFLARAIANTDILLIFNYVVQANNWREMESFVNLAEGWGADKIKFSQLVNWGTFSPEEYNLRAVHLSSHVEFPDFINYVDGKLKTNPKVVQSFI